MYKINKNSFNSDNDTYYSSWFRSIKSFSHRGAKIVKIKRGFYDRKI